MLAGAPSATASTAWRPDSGARTSNVEDVGHDWRVVPGNIEVSDGMAIVHLRCAGCPETLTVHSPAKRAPDPKNPRSWRPFIWRDGDVLGYHSV